MAQATLAGETLEVGNDSQLSYHTTRINRWTFQNRKMRQWVEQRLQGRVLNACAGKTKLVHDHEIVRNDIDEDRDADLHVDVRELHRHLEAGTFDSAILDPPFDAGRGEKLYEGMHANDYIAAREALAPLVKRGGLYIELGWNSWGLAGKDDWERVEAHHYRQPFKGDVWILVDRRIDQRTLFEQ